jgi:hypothetical protein
MPRQAVVAFLAGSLIVFTAGLIGLFAVQNTDSKYMIIAGTVSCFILMFYVMWASGQQRQQAGYEAARRTIIDYPEDTIIEYPEEPPTRAMAPAPAPRQMENLGNHGAIVRTGTKDGQRTYIEFADGHSVGTPPKDDDEKKDRDRYEAVKV